MFCYGPEMADRIPKLHSASLQTRQRIAPVRILLILILHQSFAFINHVSSVRFCRFSAIFLLNRPFFFPLFLYVRQLNINDCINRYCSHGCVPRGVFVRILHENPELHGTKLRFAVSVHREACYCSHHAAFWRGVNSYNFPCNSHNFPQNV